MRSVRTYWRERSLSIVVAAFIVLSVALPISALIIAPPTHSSSRRNGSGINPFTPPASPHPGLLKIYENTSGGGITSLDPSVAYDSVSFEPILNVYQTLIAFNGTSTSSFVPELSTCVPGASNGVDSTPSTSCQSVYGSSLVVNNAQGQPEYYTFPIDPNARYYDPSTGANWSVYPSDVLFTMARTIGFSDLPGPEFLNGWIVGQSLMPSGNHSWDGGIHSPYNNTPQHILGSLLVNDSAYCPPAALAERGCVTFNASGGGQDWPFFLELVSDVLGSGIQPCGWFTYKGASVPGFLGTNAPSGDGPCLLPGNATSSQSSAFTSYVNSLSPTAWDAFEQLANSEPAVQPAVQFNAVGSGPYYLSRISQLGGYNLTANPAYHQPIGCVGVGGGCQPAVGTYIPNVNVTYEPNDTLGLSQYRAGQADSATISAAHTSQLLNLTSHGNISYDVAPTINSFFMPYNLNFNVSAEAGIDPVGGLNVGSTFFASSTVRNLVNHAWNYTTFQSALNSVDGVDYGFNGGGAIPVFMGNYYPQNISWPYLGGNPGSGATLNTSVNSAYWWWQEGTTNPGNPYYDPALAQCLNTTCKFPIIGEIGNPALNAGIGLLIKNLHSISGGALQPYEFNLSFSSLIGNESKGPGNNPMPFWNLGWAPDYPDPTDYVTPLYLPDTTYTYFSALQETLGSNGAAYNQSGCGHFGTSWANLTYWANYMATNGGPIPSGCQLPAYSTMTHWSHTASAMPLGAGRALVYNEIEHIENQLGLYLWYNQQTAVTSFASWISPSSVNMNIMIGGGGDQPWYEWKYAVAGTPVTFTETGLLPTTFWSAVVNGNTLYSQNATIQFILPNGNYQYSIPNVTGYRLQIASGGFSVTGTPVNVGVVFASHSAASFVTTFHESGLPTGTSWSVTIDNGSSALSTNGTIAFSLTNGSYYFSATSTGYLASPATGTVVVAGAPVSQNVLFSVAPPGAPTGLSAVAVSTSQIDLAWTNPSGPLVNDFVYLYSNSGCSALIAKATIGVATSFIWSGQQADTLVAFQVGAATVGGAGPLSGCVSVNTFYPPPPAPTGLTATAVSSSEIDLSWTNPSLPLLSDAVSIYSGGTCSALIGVAGLGVTTTFAWGNLTANTTYSFTVAGSTNGGEGPASACASNTTLSPPPSPTGLTAAFVDSTTIALSWTNPTKGGPLTDNTVYLYSGGTCSAPISSYAAGVVLSFPWDWGGLTPSTTYSFEVTASNAYGESVHSNCASASTSPPPAPTGLTTSVLSSTTIGLTWTNPATGGPLTGNKIYLFAGTGCSSPLESYVTGVISTFPWDWGGLTPSTTYSFEVTASNAVGESAFSNCANASTAPPPAPTGLTAGVVSSTVLSLTWTNPTSGGPLTDNVVYQYSGSTCSTPIASFSAGVVTSFPWNWGGLTPATAYSFEVTASNGVGESVHSVCANATTGPPPAPTGLSASALSNTTISLTWTNPTVGGPLTNNVVYEYSGSACSSLIQSFTAGLVTTFPWNWGGLTNLTTYSFEVTAVNGAGESAHSACSSATTLAHIPVGSPRGGVPADSATTGSMAGAIAVARPGLLSVITGVVPLGMLGAVPVFRLGSRARSDSDGRRVPTEDGKRRE